MIRIYICDDLEDICNFFKNIINSADDMQVVGVSNNSHTAVEEILELKPDVVLMDIQMETREAGIEATKRIYDKCPDIKTIMLTAHEDEDLIVRSYIAGAVDYLTKLSRPEYILEEIRKVYTEEILIGPVIAANIRKEIIKTKKMQTSLMFMIVKWSALTSTEVDIIRLIAEGNSRKEIADIKKIELSTVKTHINNILKKLDYPSTKRLIHDLESIGMLDYVLYKKESEI